MKNLLFTLIVLFSGLKSISQTKENYIELKSGTIIPVEANVIMKRDPSTNGFYFQVGDQKYATWEVKGYMQDGTYFGNFNDLGFMERLAGGKINLFQQTEEIHSSKGGTRTRIVRYLQKGVDSPCVRYTFSRLKRMIRGNDEALKLAKAYKREKGLSYVYKLGSGLTVLAGATLILFPLDNEQNTKSKTSKTILGSALVLVGLGGTSLSIMKSFKSDKKLIKAVSLYNKT